VTPTTPAAGPTFPTLTPPPTFSTPTSWPTFPQISS
jgi:hypothetical protein